MKKKSNAKFKFETPALCERGRDVFSLDIYGIKKRKYSFLDEELNRVWSRRVSV